MSRTSKKKLKAKSEGAQPLKYRPRQEPLAKCLAEGDIERILEAAHVSRNFQLVGDQIDIAICWFQTRDFHPDPGRRKAVKLVTQGVADLARNLSEGLREAMDELGPTSSLFDFDSTDEYISDRDDPDDASWDVYAFMSLLSDFIDNLKPRPSPRKSANRPPNSSPYPEIRYLISALYDPIVILGGGELTVSQNVNGKLTGTAAKILNILGNRLPGKVPANFGVSTLRRFVKAAAMKKNV